MAHVAPEEAFESLKKRTSETIKEHFPIKGATHTLEAKRVWVDDTKDIDDIRDQKEVKLKGRSWTVPIKAELQLKDENGKVVDKQVINVAQLPKITRRYSYIVNGNEWQMNNLFRLKSGVYTRQRKNGELTSQWNLAKGSSFNMDFSPKNKKMTIRYNEANIPLYPVLKTMGVDDDTIERAWGKEILNVNKKDKEDTALRKFYRAIRGANPENLDEAKEAIRERFAATQLRPESTKLTLGTAFDTVNGKALLTGSNRILKVARQEEAPDDRNQLQFKELHSAEDLINERMSRWQTGRDVKRKIGNTVDKHTKIRNIVSPDVFGKPLRNLFVSSTLSENPEQTNPVSFLAGNRKTTLFAPGEGGIGSTHQITTEAQALNPTHLGFLDPIQTPECYDPETEVFTSKGWKKWPDVTDSDLFACRIDGRLKFHPAKKLHARHYQGTMYGLDSGKIHYLVTPNHRILFSTTWRPDIWRIDRADRVHGKERSFDCGHDPHEMYPEGGASFCLPEVTGSNAVKNHGAIDMTVWAEFMGWFLSEGSVSYSEEDSTYLVRISQLQSANPQNWKSIQALLDMMPQTWGHDSECRGFHTRSKQLASYLVRFGHCDEKYIPEPLFDAPVVCREALFEALLLGDGRLGSNRSDGRSYSQKVFTTTSPKLADGFERLAIELGHSTTHKVYADKREERYLDVHEVRVLKHRIRTARPKHPYYPAEYYTVDYDGMVYCATVPGGLLLVRRSGGVGFWCGNSDRIGVTLQMASHAEKVGHDLVIPVYNVKKGRTEKITPYQALKSNLAFPDQYNWSKGKPQPVKKAVKVSDPDGTVTVVKPGEVDYVVRSSKGMFDLAANMIPFLQNDQGNRTMVAAKQLEQALSLKEREAPLVQTRTDNPRRTFEEGIGAFVGHTSTVDGTIAKVKKDGIIVKDSAGKRHEVQIYDDFPLNDDKSVITSTPLVKVGDKVKRGQPLADTNFTKEGVLALGTNLNVAYMPYKGYNFEDGIVISESASKKLTSGHMLRESVSAEKSVMLDKKKFLSYMAGKVTKEQADKLDDNGVIKEGELVGKDDVIAGVMKEEAVTVDEQKLGLFAKGLVRPWKPREVRWTKDEPGKVTKVVRHGKKTTVYIKTEAPAGVGDKIVGRHGNKGIITNVLPDHEMPQRADGSSVDVLLNPTGIPTRINLGQVLETAAGKLAQKTGKPYIVNNFDPNVPDYTRSLQAELKKNGVSDTEDLVDPITKRKYPKVLTGPQYIMKLHHTAEKGLSVRSRDAYDSNMLPQKGGPKGGQTMDAMGLYAMLAHDARENIREMQTYKSDMNDSFWAQLQAGDPIPAPKTPFVFKKFEGYLKGMGLDTRKEGNNLILQPLTDKKVLEMSNGALADAARTLRAKDAKEEPGGIFDPKVTGGARGKKWSHVVLPERMPNPVFEAPVTSLLGLNRRTFKGVVNGEQELNGKTGPDAVVSALKGLNTKEMKKDLEKKVRTLRTSKLDAANKQLKYVRALDRAGMSPTEAYTMKYLPIIPPQYRPFTVLDSGHINYEDVNRLYNHIGTIKLKFADFDPALPPEEKLPLQTALYDGLKAVTLTGHVHQGRHRNAIIETIASPEDKQPKEGYFQDKIIGRRQDLSMRGTIVPEPSLSLDEVGLPRKAAMELYKPFVVRRLTLQGGGLQGGRPLIAQNMVKENHPAAISALEAEIRERPIMLKRDPVLHKFGVQTFRPQLVEGKAIKIHPLATAGYNADFDGDKMSAFVPVSPKAVRESYKMLPSNNLFNPSTGFLISKPTQEAMLGLYKLTEVEKNTGKRFKSAADAALAVKKGEIGMNDVVTLDSLDGDLFDSFMKKEAAPIKTTVGRAMLYQSLPEDVRDPRLLSDQKYVFNKDNLYDALTDVAKKTPGDFGVVSDKFKDMGNEFATGLSIGLDDFVSDSDYRDKVLKEAGKRESTIRSRSIPSASKREKIVDLYVGAADKITKHTQKRADASKNRMYDWVKSGARGSWDQFKQMTVSPVLVGDSNGNPVPIPIPKAYSEGLDIGSYFASMHGARMGTIGRVQGTQAPGKMSKQLINTTMNQMVVSDDCGTTKGVVLDIDSRDLLDRFTVRDVRLGKKGGADKGAIPAGTLVTPDVVGRLRNNKISRIEVRSTLKCAHGQGLCAKCYGVDEEGSLPRSGSNLGVVAAQALGEPATQLAMNAFHTGGVVGAKGTQAAGMFQRLEQLLNVPKTLPGAATLADTEGTVSKVEKDVAVGGWRVHVKNPSTQLSHYVPAARKLTVKRGDSVKMGDSLSSGPKNPRELLRRTNMNAVQKYLTDEIWNAYKDEGPVRRRNVETFVRSMTNLSEVTDPGDHEALLSGDLTATSEVQSFNRKLVPGSKPVQYRPVLQGINMLPLDLQTDWLARMQSSRLKSTVLDASAEGWRSALHSTHPIPAMAYGKEFGKGTADAPWLY